MPWTPVLGIVLFISELGLRIGRRSSSASARSADRASLDLVWVTILLALGAGVWLARALPRWGFHLSTGARVADLALFAAGLGLRWWSIMTLGRFFTVDVAIHADHRLVTAGPYRLVRHPSYTGLLLLFAAIAISYEHWGALIVVLVPILTALLYRIHVEEEALSDALGPDYAEYRRTTKALLPGLY